MEYNVEDPWAISDHGGDFDMVGHDLDIMDVSEDEHVRTACTPAQGGLPSRKHIARCCFQLNP